MSFCADAGAANTSAAAARASLQADFHQEPPTSAERAIARRAPNFRGNSPGYRDDRSGPKHCQSARASTPRRSRATSPMVKHKRVNRRDPDRTREAILTAAQDEFAAKGLFGGRVNTIARCAGANKRMIYHYFGNKEGLYLAALERVYEGLRGSRAHARSRAPRPRTRDQAPGRVQLRLLAPASRTDQPDQQRKSAPRASSRALQEGAPSCTARSSSWSAKSCAAVSPKAYSVPGSIRSTSTSRSRRSVTSICRTTGPCPPFSDATSARPPPTADGGVTTWT